VRKIVASGLIVLAAVLGTAVTAVVAGPASASAVAAQAPTATPARELAGVSCVSPKYCAAVGIDQRAFNNMGGPLIQTWNGKVWKTAAARLPAGAVGGDLFSVSCKSATECKAVGFFFKKNSMGLPLLESWNGTKWAPSEPRSLGGGSDVLAGVSCPTAKSCVAVGTLESPSSSVIAEIWNGKTWALTRPPLPHGTREAFLGQVSCASPAFCTAVGQSSTSSGATSPLVEVWNGKHWARTAVVAPPGSALDASLNGVSCTSARSCVAVGAGASSKVPHGPNGFTEVWNGTKWAAGKIAWPKGTANSWLVGVSCSSAKSCMTVGYIDINVNGVGNTGKAAAASWNGTTWTARAVPAPGKGKASLFNAVSCLSAASCVAAGQLSPFKSTEGSGLAGFWNGNAWKLVTTP
jgi:hypothetical protein